MRVAAVSVARSNPTVVSFIAKLNVTYDGDLRHHDKPVYLGRFDGCFGKGKAIPLP